MPDFKEEIHYGAKVWVSPKIEALRGTDCLCLNCELLDDCPTAELFYRACVFRDIALAVTRCKNWSEK